MICCDNHPHGTSQKKMLYFLLACPFVFCPLRYLSIVAKDVVVVAWECTEARAKDQTKGNDRNGGFLI